MAASFPRVELRDDAPVAGGQPVACAGCGRQLEAMRAWRLRIWERQGGETLVAYACSAECAQASQAPPAQSPALPLSASPVPELDLERWERDRESVKSPRRAWPYAAVCVLGAALLVAGALASGRDYLPSWSLLSLGGAVILAGAISAWGWAERAFPSSAATVLAAVGAVFGALAGVVTRFQGGDARLVLAGAAVAASSLAVRLWLRRRWVPFELDGSSEEVESALNAAPLLAFERWVGIGAPVVVVAVAAAGVALAADLARSLSVIAAVCLGAPLVVLGATARSVFMAARRSAAVRGIEYASSRVLERAGRTFIAALCSRGTVTVGRPEVVSAHALDDDTSDAWLALAVAAEAADEGHVVAQALRRSAAERKLPAQIVRQARVLPGRGVSALTVEGAPVLIGSRQHLLDAGVSVARADTLAAEAEAAGRTPVFVACDGRVRAVFVLEDPLRSGARPAVQRLIDLDMDVVLLSGGHRGTADALARELDIDHVRAELLDAQRRDEVVRLQETGGSVAVIGQRSEDGAVLEVADVAIVMRTPAGAGERNQVSVGSDDPRDAAAALWIARAARDSAMRRFTVSLAGSALLLGLGLTDLLGPGVLALGCVMVEVYVLPGALRLERRVNRRVPH